MNRQNSSASDFDSESSQWSELLVRLFEAWERGDSGDLERIRHEHPEHADSIFEFLNDQAHCRDVLGTIRDDTPQPASSTTVQWHPRDSLQTSGLVVLALCLISMIRRVRGLADYFACGR